MLICGIWRRDRGPWLRTSNAIFKHETGNRSCKKVKAPEPHLGALRAEGVHPPCDLASGRRNKPHLRSRERPVYRSLGLRYGLRFSRRLARCLMVRVESDRPFPDMPADSLND